MGVKVGIIGAGVMETDHARILHHGLAGADLVAIQDADGERARWMAGDCGLGRCRFEDAYREQMRAWVTSIGTGMPAGSSAWDGYVVSATATACLTRCGQGQGSPSPVQLEPRPDFYG